MSKMKLWQMVVIVGLGLVAVGVCGVAGFLLLFPAPTVLTLPPPPTRTPQPTYTPRPMYTPEPTWTPSPTPTEVSVTGRWIGTGVSRDTVQSLFEETGFAFENRLPIDSVPRIGGDALGGLSMLEFIGPPENVISACFIGAMPSDAQDVVDANALIMAILMEILIPEWEEKFVWAENALRTSEGNEIATTYENLRVSLISPQVIGMVTLIIEDEEWYAVQEEKYNP